MTQKLQVLEDITKVEIDGAGKKKIQSILNEHLKVHLLTLIFKD